MSSSNVTPPPIPEVATFHEGPGGLTRLRIATSPAEAEIVLQGAHLTHFQPSHSSPVLFLSRSSFFEPGKPIRGGIPVCFPWFGARSGRPDSPAHGFARTLPWQVESLEGSNERGVTVALRLTSDGQTRAHWPHDFVARLRFEFTEQLALSLEVENTGSAPCEFEEALHTYFAVSDTREVFVTGLETAVYLDKTDGFRRKRLGPEPWRLTGETDRVFPRTVAPCFIEDRGFKRRIIIEKTGSQTTVVWNPWIGKSAALKDFGDDEWTRMLCIETANAGEDAITLAPGTRHTMTVRVITARAPAL